ncbi:MAG: flagellar hook-basal body complex protein FliE [Acidiphilium sp.]
MTAAIAALPGTGHALAAYGKVAGGEGQGEGFGAYMSNLMTSAIRQGATTETAARSGMLGQGDLSQVAASVAQAQVALQTAVALRDRMVQAYQSIMSMPI